MEISPDFPASPLFYFSVRYEYTVRVAETIHEACKLVEAGFECVTEMDECKIFWKSKKKPRY
jgi:hypothetical protein